MRVIAGSSVNCSWNWAKSTCAWSPRRRLEADLEGRQPDRTNVAQHVSDGGIAALIAAFAKLPQQSAAGQARIGCHPLAQIRNEWIEPALARLTWAIDRRHQAAGDAFTHGLAVDPEFAGDRRDRQSLPMKIKYHDNFPKLDHHTAPSF